MSVTTTLKKISASTTGRRSGSYHAANQDANIPIEKRTITVAVIGLSGTEKVSDLVEPSLTTVLIGTDRWILYFPRSRKAMNQIFPRELTSPFVAGERMHGLRKIVPM